MAERWIFTKEQLQNTPSRRGGIDYAKELAYRQQAANLIQDMGQRLHVNQLCINTAIVYMHRFYMFQSFTRFHRNVIAPACLFLAAKVEEQLRKLEHVIRVARTCLNRDSPPLDTKSEAYLEQAQELVVNENILLQSLGFDIQVDHPHTHVVKTCQLVRASKDLAQTSYFLATNSLHLTAMCLQYKPTVVACVCIHLASKWSEYEIAVSHEGRPWYSYVDKSVSPELLAGLTQEFLDILDSCPLRLKKKILTWKSGNRGEEECGPPEKRHRGEASSSGISSNPTLSGSHEKHGESSKSDRKSETTTKSHRSETVALAGNDSTKVPTDDDPFRHTNTQSVPTPVRKSVSDTSVSSSKSFGQSGSVHSHASSSVDSVDGQKKVVETQKSMSFKDYKSYREHREKQEKQAAAAAATGHGSTGLPPALPHDGERKPHSVSSSDSHRKHRHQHGSSSSGDEKKSRREHDKRSSYPVDEGGKQSDESLKVHIKKERSDESLKVHIKKESGTHKIKPTDSPLKLKIKTLSGSESSPSKSHDKTTSEHRPESLKMKLSLKPGQSGSHGERPSKHRRSESYSSHTSGTNVEMHNIQSNKHSHSSRSSTVGVDGNGVHDPGRSNSRHSNSHHKGAEHHSRTGQPSTGHQANLSFSTERGASGSIFSPPPVHQNFDANIFDTGAMLLSQTAAGGHRGNPNVSTAGYGGYHQQSGMSSNFNNSYSNFYPDMFNVGDTGQQLHGLETNGSGMSQQSLSLSTKEGLQQLQTNMQQLIGQTKSQIAHQLQLQQQHGQAAQYGMQGFMGMPGYQTNPPLPRVPPPPPPPPEDPPQPPPPPPSN